jgi:hypothetical protein
VCRNPRARYVGLLNISSHRPLGLKLMVSETYAQKFRYKMATYCQAFGPARLSTRPHKHARTRNKSAAEPHKKGENRHRMHALHAAIHSHCLLIAVLASMPCVHFRAVRATLRSCRARGVPDSLSGLRASAACPALPCGFLQARAANAADMRFRSTPRASTRIRCRAFSLCEIGLWRDYLFR